MKKLAALAGLFLALLLPCAPAFALGDIWPPQDPNRPRRVAAPEIDATSGTKALAVLVGGLLLAGEALRRRR